MALPARGGEAHHRGRGPGSPASGEVSDDHHHHRGPRRCHRGSPQRFEQLDPGGPLLVDLTHATPICGPAVVELLARLEASSRRSATVLVHEDLDARRALRAMSHRLPVVPSVDQAVGGHFSAALAPRQAVAGAMRAEA